MKITIRWGTILIAAAALFSSSGLVAQADYPQPRPTTPSGQRVVDIVTGWNQIFPGSVDAWELDGTAARVAYTADSELVWPPMQDDLRAKMRLAGASSVTFKHVALTYSAVEAVIASLEKRYSSQLDSGELTAIQAVPGYAQRSVEVRGETASVNLVRSQVGDAVNGVPMNYLPGAQPAPAGLDVYLTPGTHLLNGREWRTRCEPYSQTYRCRTEIKATTISLSDGVYTQTTGWAFNNLTYAPSPASLWRGNPLGSTAQWTAADGRQWRTECDTALTGRNACRSFVMATVIAVEGGQFVQRTDWQFNNMVRFS